MGSNRSLMASFRISFRLKIAYRINSIIYILKRTPIIKKFLPISLYKSQGLKSFAKIISFIWEIISAFIGKILYLQFMIGFVALLYNGNNSDIFINIFVFLTILGGLTNPQFFQPSKDKYYAIKIMRFKSKDYVLSNYYYFLIKTLVSFMILTIIYGSINGVPLGICISMPFFVISIKNLINAWSLRSEKNRKIVNPSDTASFCKVAAIVIVLLGLAYGLPLTGFLIGEELFYVVFVPTLISGALAMVYIQKYNDYKKICLEVLEISAVFISIEDENKKSLKEKITIDKKYEVKTNKIGFEYFHEMFVRRHSKTLMKSTKIISIISVLVFIIIIAVAIFNEGFNNDLNETLKKNLPCYLFIMYFINRGQSIVQILFMNCDCNMLHYRFYREPQAILKIFKERLKTIAGLNIIPGTIIGVGTSILLFVTGGADIKIYILITLGIMSMSVFFSVHYLVMYYLFQPFNEGLEMKDNVFNIVNLVVYFLCYGATKITVPTDIFAILMIGFAVIYCLVGINIAYKKAPKTFRLKE